jgi:hypothetical protein
MVQPHRAAALATLGLVVLWASCDTTGLEADPVVVELRMEVSQPQVDPGVPGQVPIDCTVTLTALVSGRHPALASR